MIGSSYDFQAHQQRSQRRCFSHTALLWLEVLPDMSPALPGLSPVLQGALRLVVGASSYSEDRQECPPMVWYSPEIDPFKFTLHILSDTPGGFQWLKYILLMYCNAGNAATKNMTQDVHLKIVSMTGSSTNKRQRTVGCEHTHTMVNSH
jgi:hypothetical protein